jgi:hypothetical protein
VASCLAFFAQIRFFQMGREIRYCSNESKGIAAASDSKLDSYRDKLLKLIPAEIVAAFLALKGALDAAQQVNGIQMLEWIVFAGLLVFTPLIYRFVYKVKDAKQHVLTILAFIIWVFTIGGPFDQFFMGPDGTILPIKGIIASIALIFFTLTVPMLFPSSPVES